MSHALPDSQGSHRQGVGVAGTGQPETHTSHHQFPEIYMGWGWQLAGAVLPEGVAGTSDGTR